MPRPRPYAVISLVGAGLWTVGKVVYAVQGRRGLPGLPEAGADGGGQQWGNVAVGVVCLGLIALMLRPPSGLRVRRTLATVEVVAALAVGLGAVTALLVLAGVVPPAGPEPPLVAHVAVVVGLWVWTLAWLVAARRLALAPPADPPVHHGMQAS